MYNINNLGVTSQRAGGGSSSEIMSMIMSYMAKQPVAAEQPSASSVAWDPTYGIPAANGAPAGTWYDAITNTYQRPALVPEAVQQPRTLAPAVSPAYQAGQSGQQARSDY